MKIKPAKNKLVDLDIAVEASEWTSALSNAQALCLQALDALYGLKPELKMGELSLALVDDAAIQALNREYRAKDRATNVLSFPALHNIPEMPMLGDIVVAYETTCKEAVEKGIDLSDHFTHLFIHGFLHLQGYDHETAQDAEIMESLEVSVLEALEIKNPYVLTQDVL